MIQSSMYSPKAFHDPKHFVKQIRANVDNMKLTDAQFRDFIRSTLPIYEKK